MLGYPISALRTGNFVEREQQTGGSFWGVQFLFMKNRIACVLLILVATSAFTQHKSSQAVCPSQKEFIVRTVYFEQIHLSKQEQATITQRLVGHCFNRTDMSDISATVFTSFRNFGYPRARVDDPIVRVLDETRSPKPVALTIDVLEGNRGRISESK